MMIIRPCGIEDFDAVLPLFHQLWLGKPIDSAALRTVFERAKQTRLFLCAVVDGQIVGFGSLSTKENFWQEGILGTVEELVVDEQHRKLGIGQAILNRLLEEAAKLGCRRVELDSSLHRLEAHRFYEKFGFEKRAFLFTIVPSGR
jgi:GNAT superfamily N-acetyltransferase